MASLRAPAWAGPAGVALGQAASAARMIAVTTPLNLRAELSRLEVAWSRGEAEEARFVYAEVGGFGEMQASLSRIADALDREGDLGSIYAARARELAVEAEVCAAAGGPSLWAAARRRFSRRDSFDDEADRVADAWLGAGTDTDTGTDTGTDAGTGTDTDADTRTEAVELVRSDDERDPRSLISRMRAVIGAQRLPVRVVVLRDLAPLAATGEGIVQVAAGRMISVRDVERTVLHEIEGHVAPGERARTQSLSIFAVGTAWGSDDQEGRALSIERAEGFLDAGRRRELALRHKAARSVEAGASFSDTTRLLLTHGAVLSTALRIAARAHRGGGLAREIVYIPALLRIEAALREDPSLEDVVGQGRVSSEAARALRPWSI